MAPLRFAVVGVCAVALAGCCMSTSGCNVPVAGIPAASDGITVQPDDDGDPPPRQSKKAAPAKTRIDVGSVADEPGERKPHSEEWVARKEAADREADARLAKQLIICHGCLPPPASTDGDVTASVQR
jgi:hypothetical protein